MIVISAKKAGFAFKAADFQINTKRGRYVEQARELELWQHQQLRPAFTAARQKELDEHFGLRLPGAWLSRPSYFLLVVRAPSTRTPGPMSEHLA